MQSKMLYGTHTLFNKLYIYCSELWRLSTKSVLESVESGEDLLAQKQISKFCNYI